MLSVEQFMAVCWVIFMIYWFISAQSVKSIQETRGWLGGSWHTIFYLIGVSFMLNSRLPGRLGISTKNLAILLLPPNILLSAVIVVLLISGLLVAIIARRTLAANWSSAVALKKDHELITTGLYHYIRHPIYTGMLLMFLGTTLLLGTVGACIGFFIILSGFLLKLRREEALMTEHFAQEYTAYKKQTKTLIPFIW
jgi:protein-S-isoprenylcysteine O-methyltransferase Ste14